MSKRWASICFVVCFTVMLLGALPAQALSGTETCFFNKTNASRSEAGRSKLVVKGDLVSVARAHSERMADDGTIYHNSNLSKEVGGGWWAIGENVGMGPTCSSLHDAFMDSPGHRANILDKDYNQVGIGVVILDETIYVTVVFAGRPMGGSVPKPKVVTAPKPAPPKPVPPKPKPVVAAPRTLPMLLLMLGMDVDRTDPATGRALGI